MVTIIKIANSTHGAFVCRCHYDLVKDYRWYKSKRGYIVRDIWDSKTRKKSKVLMHRVINNTPKGAFTDHLNQVKYDNRCNNLRTCNYSQNLRNVAPGKNNTSGYKGVTWDRKNKKWSVVITCDYKARRIGRFTSIKEAVIAYNSAATDLFGEFAYQNEVPNE